MVLLCLRGIHGCSIDINTIKGLSLDNLVESAGNMAIDEVATRALEKILGKAAGFLLQDGSSGKIPQPGDVLRHNAIRSYNINIAKKMLIDQMFRPLGPSQTPSMFNNFSSYSVDSRYAIYYKNH